MHKDCQNIVKVSPFCRTAISRFFIVITVSKIHENCLQVALGLLHSTGLGQEVRGSSHQADTLTVPADLLSISQKGDHEITLILLSLMVGLVGQNTEYIDQFFFFFWLRVYNLYCCYVKNTVKNRIRDSRDSLCCLIPAPIFGKCLA